MYRKRSRDDWRKVLYLNQPYPDNYVHRFFLRDLKKNINLRWYSLTEILRSSCIVLQEISLVMIFIEFFIILQTGHQQASIYSCISLVTLLLYPVLLLSSSDTSIFKELKTGFIFIISGFVVSPILRTLTETVSTDTIYTMTALMMIVHLLFLDYGIKGAITSPPLSINSAIFAGVCLASRLSHSYQVFALLTWATDIFVVFPMVQKKLICVAPPWFKLLTEILIVKISFVLLLYLSNLYFIVIYAVILVLVGMLFPYRFYEWQFYKENIYGPWDEAILDKDPEKIE